MDLKLLAPATLCAAAALLQQPLAGAQTAAAPAASAAASKALSMGNGKTGGPLLTRDELRVCLKQEPELRSKLEALQTRRAPLVKQKADLAAEKEALLAERAHVDEVRKQVADLSERLRAYSARVESWNKRVAELDADPPSASKADRQRDNLKAERTELEMEQKSLNEEKAKLSQTSQDVISAYNAKATSLEARIKDWNERNEAWANETTAAESERLAWVEGCANRRYREDDEIAIQRGK